MRLNDKDQEKLLLHLAGNLAKERRARGLKLNYPESVALIRSHRAERGAADQEAVRHQ